MPTYALTMLFAGLGIPVLAALNAELGVRLGSPVAAAAILFCVALTATLIVLALTGPAAILRAEKAPRHLFLAGFLVAFYILSVTIIAPKIGVGNAVFLVLLGQVISAAAIDHFGLFTAQMSTLTPIRGLGIGVMALGVWITQQA